ncbi:MAG: hypothetical protein RSE58_12120 [Clostridia bacterium]
MSFVTNERQQISLTDSFCTQSLRTHKCVESALAKGFAEIVLPAIKKEHFSVRYSDKASLGSCKK